MKIRYKTWYWGNFVVAKSLPTGPDSGDWEVYVEELHGWHHSEEFRQGRKVKYERADF